MTTTKTSKKTPQFLELTPQNSSAVFQIADTEGTACLLPCKCGGYTVSHPGIVWIETVATHNKQNLILQYKMLEKTEFLLQSYIR